MTLQEINLKKYFDNDFWLMFAGFFIIRLVSFLLVDFPVLENILSSLIIVSFIWIYFKNQAWGFIFLLSEIFLGGTGLFMELGGISIRTYLLLIFLLLYYWQFFFHKKYKKIDLPRQVYYLLFPFFILILSSALIGIKNQHELSTVISDLIPFFYLLLITPFIEYLEQKIHKIYLIKLIMVLILGSALWSFFNFILFTTSFHIIHDDYYKWLRAVNLGKITQITQYYYRIVFPEHLLIVPLLLLINSYWAIHKNKIFNLLIISSILILSLNFSRGYFLGLIIGLLFLKYKNTWRAWLKIVLYNGLLMIVLFSGINFLASSGQSLGWEMIGLRISSLVTPTIEESSNNRILLLEPIKKLIHDQPILGHGLGQGLDFTNSKGKLSHTKHFDWGYLEMWVEWGLITLSILLIFILSLINSLCIKIQKNQSFYLGLLAGIISVLIINITVPALFHVLGIIYLSLIIPFILTKNQP